MNYSIRIIVIRLSDKYIGVTMRKVLILSAIILLTMSEIYAFAVKVYDEYGNRVGTYRKEGGSYQLYDFHDRKIENPANLIKNAPDSKTLTEYSQTFYDENMIPIGTWHSGFYGSNGRYYPRYSEFVPAGFRRTQTPYIVRPHGYTQEGIYKYADYKDNVNSVDTRFPKFHKFKN